MQDLNITLVQTSLVWEDIPANLRMLDDKLDGIQDTDLIVLPEMFTTGFSMNAKKLAETMDGSAVTWMKEMSAKANAVVTGSLIIEENGQYYNRLIWMRPDETFDVYDKGHLFRMANEHETYTGGDKILVTEWRGWKICPQICYDLRFPVWNRNIHDYDLLLFVANWPERRIVAWNTLLRARAIENLSYVVGLNRVGDDENSIHYTGDSLLIDPGGELLYHKQDDEDIHTQRISGQNLVEFRKRLQFLVDQDNFVIKR